MKSKSKNKSKKAILLIFSLFSIGIIPQSCVTVQPWEREELISPIMMFDENPIDKGIQLHHIDHREGSSGATGSQSGGCGCG